MKDIITVVVGIVLLGVVWVGWGEFKAWQSRAGGIACTLEAKICPDGSAVGRTGPKCEFAKCPDVTETGSGIQGVVLLGPICPVERIPPDPACAPRAYETTLMVTSLDGAYVIKEFRSDREGKFRFAMSPGDYAIRSAVAGNVLPYCSSNDTIHVKAGAYTETTVACDTGIR